MQTKIIKVKVPAKSPWTVQVANDAPRRCTAYEAYAVIASALASSFQYGQDAGFDAEYTLAVSREIGGVQ